jgi:hypothetical protein
MLKKSAEQTTIDVGAPSVDDHGMETGELVAMAAVARANREWSQLKAILSELASRESDPQKKLAYLRERAQVEEVELFDTHALVATWEAIVAIDPSGQAELARATKLRDG